jgi:predicted RNA binding protein with dsRBD fold (UPF0201 family)
VQGSAKCLVYPTEDQERIRKAIENVITSNNFSYETYDYITEIRLSFEGRSNLEWLRNKIYELRIIDAVRARLRFNWNGSETRISLDKQAAYHGKIKLLDDREELPPLGCIELQLKFDNEDEFEGFLRHFTPPTKEGHVVI